MRACTDASVVTHLQQIESNYTMQSKMTYTSRWCIFLKIEHHKGQSLTSCAYCFATLWEHIHTIFFMQLLNVCK